MTVEKAQALAEHYADRLGMDNWMLRVREGTDSQLTSKDADKHRMYGYVVWHKASNEATITLDLSRDDNVVFETLKHELLHLRLEGHRKNPLPRYTKDYETALNKIAEAL
jgi:hypothetical protein